MRKYVLLGVFLLAAWVGHTYFTTGELPTFGREVPDDIRQVRALKVAYLETHEKFYASLDRRAMNAESLDHQGTAVALRDVERLERALEALRPELESEIAKAEAGWLRMKLRRFKKRLNVAQADES